MTDNPTNVPSHQSPPPRTLLLRGLTRRCPACGQGHLFSKWFRIAERCPRCNLKFERIEGHWLGAVATNTVLSFGALLLTLIVAGVAMSPDVNIALMLILCVGVAALIPPLIDPHCRTVWTAVDIAMRPLEDDEVNWNVVSPESVQEQT